MAKRCNRHGHRRQFWHSQRESRKCMIYWRGLEDVSYLDIFVIWAYLGLSLRRNLGAMVYGVVYMER